ncbi:MAG: 3-isopropylmalate dehydratase large subunit [Pegethrix bostrychoides GSE-TBD4-15B]|jgi:homoaconitate hydratase family protein|uniref:3-isopropylmalate dehydratase large subunit n=1 Tax=Pegethrix bostrychoides GSE-TBD4-15B TaxID=2839662 RepID=A0A951U699_9CYAN|nr:3-isopropylmalate dehydratase large subunit [Pegethrix bostrychoides GSE-TBD4-15B]
MLSDKILVLGDDINTDDIIPAKRGTNLDPAHLGYYALEYLIGAGQLANYEIIEAGENFGCGSSREIAPLALKAAGIQKIYARSFAEIFYRNSINIGLPLEIIGEQRSSPIEAAIVAAGGLFAFNQQRLNGAALPVGQTAPRPMTLAEKLIARAAGQAYVQPGEALLVKADLAMSHDAIAGPVGALFHQHFGAEARLWDAQRLVLVADHFIQINEIRPDPKAIAMHQQMVEFAQAQGCHLLDVVSPGEAAGICHVLLPERGFVHPGMVIVGTDSHSCTYGAFGCFSTGIGTTDMANLFATGDLWLRVPATLKLELNGILPKQVSAKDIMLFILGKIGCDGAIGRVIEFCGEVIENLPIDERMTLANMAVECGAVSGLIAPDAQTWDYVNAKGHLNARGHMNARGYEAEPINLASDPGAEYERLYQFDLSQLEPQIARPPQPDQVVGISEMQEVKITRAFIGSCTGGKLFDLAQAAAVLQNRRVAAGVSLFVVPASQAVRQQAEALGYLKTLEQAGAQILKSGCGACINAGQGVLGAAEVGIYATNRNFRGRSGDPTAQNYLASPRTVAISAVNGRISDRFED